MKIGIITLFHENYNYGAVLQAYALQKAIESIGNTAEIIDYDRTVEPIDSINNSLSLKLINKIRTLRTYGDVYNLLHILSSNKRFLADIQKRRNEFEKFYREYLKVSKYYNLGTIFTANNEYDGFICGSDQIWRPSSFDANFYLSFADKKKIRISYAASLGVKNLSSASEKEIVSRIGKLDAVSVREIETAELLNQFNLNVKVNLDPTLLWNKQFWNEVAVETHYKKKSYILCYFIGENNANRNLAKKIARIKKMPLVAIPGISRIMPYDFHYADINETGASPNEFLGLIRDAALVVTDSFHACAFSVQFETPFVVTERFASKDVNSMNGRIYDLLKMFDLEKQLIRRGQTIRSDILNKIEPNYSKYEILKKDSWKYLQENLPVEYIGTTNVSTLPVAVYAAQCKEKRIRIKSSSGGIFYCLAKHIIMRSGIVISCRLDEQGKAIHDICTSMNDLFGFMTSKYVQSDIRDTFTSVAEYLKKGIEVLFVGTPCQVEGLQSYLMAKKINTKKLFSVDIICHGVPSPYVWNEYLKGVVSTNNKNHVKVNFRHKHYGWRKFSMCIENGRGKRYLKDKSTDLYLRAFLNNAFLRPSCYQCRFKSLKHVSDLTLGDFWHFDQVKSSIKDDDTGMSLVISQNEKGEQLLKTLNEEILLDSMSYEVVSKANKNMFLSARICSVRRTFFKNYELFKKEYLGNDSMQVYLNKLFGESIADKIKKIIKRIVRK